MKKIFLIVLSLIMALSLLGACTQGKNNPDSGSDTVAVTGVSLDKTSLDLSVGNTATLTATVTPANATDNTVKWTSSATSVATVNGGIVTGIAAGTATIMAKAGSFTATCAVTVTEEDEGGDEESYYTITFVTDDYVTVTVFETQDMTADGEETSTAYSRNSETGELTDTDGQVNFVLTFTDGYEIDEISIEGTYNKIKGSADTGVENGYRITKIASNLTVTVTSKSTEEEEDISDALIVTFCTDDYVTITVYKTQDMTTDGTVSDTAYARDSATGAVLSTGKGQVNFVLTFIDGYELNEISATPAENYTNLKDPSETEVTNGYRLTKITGDITVTVTSKASSSDSDVSDGKVYDTSGNEITSGTYSVTFTSSQAHAGTATKTLSAAYLINGVTVNITSGTYESASDSSDQVVFLVVNGGTLNITGSSSNYVTINKSGSGASSGQVGDDYNFYGINSTIVVAGSSSTATIQYANINSQANGSNSVVATNSGSIMISNSKIVSGSDSNKYAGARGLHTTYGGSITADTVTITTYGASCASLANDRGGGTIIATNMTLETNSNGSPLVYSTDSITVGNSTGTANAAQMVVVEGGSSAILDNCTFSCTGSGNRTGTSDSNSSSHTVDAGGIFIYQSQSGDSADGTDYFTATNCTLTITTSGVPMFYITNITAEITLSDNDYNYNCDYFMIAEATNQWGTTGSNGATVTLYVPSSELSTYNGYSYYTGSTSSITKSTSVN